MKGLLVAVLTGLAYVVVITGIFRSRPIQERAATMLRLFFGTVVLFVLIHRLTPPGLGILPERLVEPNWPADLGFGLIAYAAFFFGGILQVYAQADRGFSLRILLDIEEAPGKALSLDEVMCRYAQGKGIGWLCERRIEGMLRQGLIATDADDFRNTRIGERVASILGWMRQWLRIEPPK